MGEEREKIWRVRFKFGYRELIFDFDNINEASDFVVTATKSYNQEVVDDKQTLWCSIAYVDKTVVDDDD